MAFPDSSGKGREKNFVNFLEKKVSSLLWDSAAFQAPE